MGEYLAKQESLFPILETKPIGPLARRANESELDSTGCLTEYRPLVVHSILSKVASKRRIPFTHAINPYRGCEFGCRYCYARYTHEFLERTPEDFEHNIFFKQNAAWLLRQELKKLNAGTQIALGTATDPYQPLERKQQITRSLLQVFSETSGFRLGIVTKSTMIVRDLELLKEVAQRHKLTIHLTITTTDEKLARILEPRAPRPDLRLATVAQLRGARLRAGVLCSPLMPGITDSRRSISAVAKGAAAANANFFAAGALFLKPCSLPTFFEFVRQHFPDQMEAYRRRYSKSAFVDTAYRKRITDLVESIRREYKLGDRYYSGNLEYEDAQMRGPLAEVQALLPFQGGPSV